MIGYNNIGRPQDKESHFPEPLRTRPEYSYSTFHIFRQNKTTLFNSIKFLLIPANNSKYNLSIIDTQNGVQSVYYKIRFYNDDSWTYDSLSIQ